MSAAWLDLTRLERAVAGCKTVRSVGTVTRTVGLLVESRGPAVGVGEFCEIQTRDGTRIRTQVIGFRDGQVLSMPLEEVAGLQLGDTIVARSQDSKVGVSNGLVGRVLDGFGRPMDGGPPVEAEAYYDIYAAPPGPLEREPITDPLVTGIRALDGFLSCGRGQRVGIFGGS